jgi:hypothetical protein
MTDGHAALLCTSMFSSVVGNASNGVNSPNKRRERELQIPEKVESGNVRK